MAGSLSKSFIRLLVLAALSQLMVVSGARKRISVEEDQSTMANAVGSPENDLLAEQVIDRSSLKTPYNAADRDLASLGFNALLARVKAQKERSRGQHIDKDSPQSPAVSEDIDEDEHTIEENESPHLQGETVEEDATVVEVEDEDVVQDNAHDKNDDAEGTPSNLEDSALENEGTVSLEDVEDEEDKQLPVVTEAHPDEDLPEVISSVHDISSTQKNEDLDQDEQLPEVTDNNPDLENDEESDEHLSVVHDTVPELTPNTACGHQDAPHVFHTITIGGFPDMIGGYNRSSLNGEYAEVACDPISGRETYWKGKAGPLLFYCKKQNVWLVSMPEYLPQARKENCVGFARGSIGKDILAPEFMPFNRTYNHEISGWQNLTEVAVTALTVQDSP